MFYEHEGSCLCLYAFETFYTSLSDKGLEINSDKSVSGKSLGKNIVKLTRYKAKAVAPPKQKPNQRKQERKHCWPWRECSFSPA